MLASPGIVGHAACPPSDTTTTLGYVISDPIGRVVHWLSVKPRYRDVGEHIISRLVSYALPGDEPIYAATVTRDMLRGVEVDPLALTAAVRRAESRVSQ